MATQTMDNNTKTSQSTAQTNGHDGMFKAMNENFRSAFDNSVRFQQDTMKAMGGMFTGCDDMDDCRGKFETMSTDAMNFMRRSGEHTQKAFDECCKNGMNSMKKSFEIARGDNKDMFAAGRDMWMNMFDMMKMNVDTCSRMTTACIENTSEFVGKTMDMAPRKSK